MILGRPGGLLYPAVPREYSENDALEEWLVVLYCTLSKRWISTQNDHMYIMHNRISTGWRRNLSAPPLSGPMTVRMRICKQSAATSFLEQFWAVCATSFLEHSWGCRVLNLRLRRFELHRWARNLPERRYRCACMLRTMNSIYKRWWILNEKRWIWYWK